MISGSTLQLDDRTTSLAAWMVAAAVTISLVPIGADLAQASEGRFEIAGSASLPVRGVVKASQQATITTDIPARVNEIGFKEGQRFRKGDTLIAFDCRRQFAELAAASAQQKEMEISYQSAVILDKRNAGNRQDLEIARARLDRANAEVEGMRAKNDQCRVAAPYDGRVAELQIQVHEMPTAGKPIISVVAEDGAEIELVVPSSWLTWMNAGAEFKFFVDETQKSYPGKITRIGAAVDAVSQTIKVYGGFAPQSALDVLPGMSGAADFLKLRN